MGAGAEVSGGGAVMEMESSAAVVDEPSSPPKITTPTSEMNTEKFVNSDSEESGKIDGVKDSGLNSVADSKSELKMKEFVDMLKKLELNPQAKEFFPSSYYQSQIGPFSFVSLDKDMGYDGLPNNQRV